MQHGRVNKPADIASVRRARQTCALWLVRDSTADGLAQEVEEDFPVERDSRSACHFIRLAVYLIFIPSTSSCFPMQCVLLHAVFLVCVLYCPSSVSRTGKYKTHTRHTAWSKTHCT